MNPAEHWTGRLVEFLPRFLRLTPVLDVVTDSTPVLMHGSTSLGVDDSSSDLDVWLLLSEERLRALEQRSSTRFFEFELEGKRGHCNAESLDEFSSRVRRCDMPLLSELRTARVLRDAEGEGTRLIEIARRPMRLPVRYAWFRYHYVKMRQARRSCQGPMNRAQPIPLLQFATETIGHALRAAMLLDGEPYPYDKWLSWAARRTPTGAQVEEGAQGFLELIAEDGLRRPGPESEHPLRAGLHRIRQMLIEAARAAPIEGPWLEEWWLYLDQAREAIRWTRWEEPEEVDSMVIDPNPTPEEVRFLESRLYEFNVSATGLGDGEGLSLLVRDDDGRIVAGLAGHTWGGCCVIGQLWVSEPLRGVGLGSRLVAAAEQEARRRGCAQILVSTHSFQAPDFYTKHGFERVAAWENYPVGYQELFLRKPLQDD